MHPQLTEEHLNTQARRFMRQAILDDPDSTATGLAERTADALGHDDWLDDEGHWICVTRYFLAAKNPEQTRWLNLDQRTNHLIEQRARTLSTESPPEFGDGFRQSSELGI